MRSGRLVHPRTISLYARTDGRATPLTDASAAAARADATAGLDQAGDDAVLSNTTPAGDLGRRRAFSTFKGHMDASPRPRQSNPPRRQHRR